MADLSVLARLDRVELVELVTALADALGGLPDRALAEARVRAAERHLVRRSEAVDAALADYTRTKKLHDTAIAEKRRSTLGAELVRLAAAHRVASSRESEALDRLTRARMEAGR